jgi:metal-dependent amidase/aminoacylase/carboxypeptidase family protein
MIISVTEIKTGVGAYNVLPPKATIKGTIRAVERVTEAPQGAARSIEEVIKNYLDGISKAYNVNYDWLLSEGAPPTYNDSKLFNKVTKSLVPVWPGTLQSGDRFMFAEDFAFYTQQIPSLYFFLGVQKDGLGSGGLHSPEFTVHPDALAYGIRLMILIAQITTQGKVVLK